MPVKNNYYDTNCFFTLFTTDNIRLRYYVMGEGGKVDIVNYVRQYGVTNDKATAADVEIKKIGTWSLVGERRPTGWIE